MKKFNLDKGFVRVSLSVALLLGQSVMAEDYDSYSKSFNSDAGKAESALSTVTGTSRASGDSLSDLLAKTAEKNEKIVTNNKEELEQRIKLRNWVKKNDDIQKLKGLPDVILQKALKNRQLENDQAEALAAQLTQIQATPGDFSTGSLPKACQKNVELSKLSSTLDKMNTEPGQYLQKTAKSLINEKSEELAGKLTQKLADVMKYFKALSQKDDSTESLKADAEKGPEAVEKRIAELKAKNKEQKELNKELKGELPDMIGTLSTQLIGIKKNDKRVQELGNEFTRYLQNLLRQAKQTAQEQTDQLLSNCDTELKGLNNDIQMSTAWMVRAGISQEAAQADTQAQLARAQQMECRGVSDRVQAILQGSLSSRMNTIASAKNPTVLLSEAALAMQDVANMQSQVAQELHPLMNDCEDAANAREAVKQRIQPIMTAQGNQPGQPSSNSSNGSRSASSTNKAWGSSTANPTHTNNSQSRR